MKKLYFLVLALCSLTVVNAQIINIPDANFKARLLAASTSNSFAQDLSGFNTKIDVNNDNEIQISEALNVGRLILTMSNSTDLEGVQYFTNLKELYCDTNALTTLDVTSLVNLQLLNCQSNQLTSLNVTGLTHLTSLECDSNQLTTLDLSSLTILEGVVCSDNLLNELTIGNLTNLFLIQCGNNHLTEIDLTGVPALMSLYCENNLLTELDFSQCTAGVYVNCEQNQLTYINAKNGNTISSYDNIDFNFNPDIMYICLDAVEESNFQQKLSTYGYTNCELSTTNCTLSVNANVTSDFAVYPNPAGDFLTIESQQNERLTVVVYNALGQKVLEDRGVQNGTKIVDVSVLASGNYIVKVIADNGALIKKFIKK